MFSAVSSAQIKLSDYGFYHNEALSLYYKNHIGKSTDYTQIIDEMTKLMQGKYPSLFKDGDNSKAKALMASYSINKFDFKSFWNTNKNYFYKTYNLYQRICLIVDNILNNNLTYEQSMKLISEFKSKKDLTTNESNSITVMESVLSNSNIYWNSSPNARPGTKAIIADMAGGLLFWEGGPFGVFAAGAMSAFVNETQP